MSSHRRNHLPRVPGIRGPVLGPRDILLLVACVLGLATAWLFYAASGPGNVQPAYGQEVAAAKSLVASSGPPATVSPSSVPQRITYPAAGMDVVVHPLEPQGGDAESRSILPPGTMDGYWLTPFGTPGVGSENTTYVIGHSWEGLDAPFNHLSSAAVPGDILTVATEAGVLRYAVESVTTYTKSTLKDSPVWDAVPNRLVLISCYTEDPWGKNVVVVASPARVP
ncbi:class F sortase [Pseudarthrobacter sp. ATCC 49987]|uniref:class F sortase n=1 Tax=Pseudarthrobacter sp. ATCC 49987 TaxID=2698204 RepID=UPI00136A5586|nr:class F sortase [Pseudarthrobacter sp. ATCC 49987]